MLAALILVSIVYCAGGALPLCGLYKDRFGMWVNTSPLTNATYNHIQDHFVLGGPREALEFSKIWIPKNCSVHRFTAQSIHKIVNHIIEKSKSGQAYSISVLGDSGLRGILCGIVRILSGSELLGPLQSEICGRNGIQKEISIRQLNIEHFDVFGPNLTLAFTYVKSLTDPETVKQLKVDIKQKPNVVMLNTGTWDYDNYNRAHPGVNATDKCTNPENEATSLLRASGAAKTALLDAAKLGKDLGVRLIYRAAHFNQRYGPTCADARVVKLMQGTHWQVWENAQMSKDVWRTQCRDGFHFDRTYTHTEEAHMQLLSEAFAKKLELPGMLEIQLAQSMLFNIFHSTLKEFIDAGVTL